MERARDLFEQAVESCPAKFAKCEDLLRLCTRLYIYDSPLPPLFPFFLFVALYLLYAKLEEEHGLSRHAMAIYDRATKAVPAEEQFEVNTRPLNRLQMYVASSPVQCSSQHVYGVSA